MPGHRVVVLGASGVVGGAIARTLVRRGFGVTAVGTSAVGVERAMGGDAAGAEVRTVDLTAPSAVGDVVTGADVVVAAGHSDVLGRIVLDAAIEAGAHYVDTAGGPSFVAWARGTRHERARAAGVSALPGAGTAGFPGDLLAGLAAAHVAGSCEVHVAYGFPDGLWRGATAGSRRALAARLAQPVLARIDATLEEERVGEERRLAWFPRPVGPRHAAAVPGLEPLTVPDHLPTARVVRTYLAMSTASSELLQAAGTLARWSPARRRLERTVSRGGRSVEHPPDPTARWACVAEVATADAVGRAWAYGHDPYALTAETATVAVERLVAADVPAGVIAPSALGPPGELLDRLGATTDLRWGRATSERSGSR